MENLLPDQIFCFVKTRRYAIDGPIVTFSEKNFFDNLGLYGSIGCAGVDGVFVLIFLLDTGIYQKTH